MKKKRRKNKNSNYLIGLILIIALLCSFFLKNYIMNEIEQYRLYNDYTRASRVMTLSFNKNFDIQFNNIRFIQSSNFDEKISKGELIYDFANYNIIPILSYMKEPSENDTLVTSFSSLTDFIAYFNVATIRDREKIFKVQKNGHYYIYENNKYIYKVEKKVISKETFNNLYNEYLSSINQSSVLDNFINRLFNVTDINRKYSYKVLTNEIKNNYLDFYNENSEIILNVIGKDIENFVDYLNTMIEVDKIGNNPPVLKREFNTETINLKFTFSKLDRIYNRVSKYYKYSYQLDISDVWKQLKDLGYPKLYM